MSHAQTLIHEEREPSAPVTPRDASPRHWSLEPSTLPGAQTVIPYLDRAWRTQARLDVLPDWHAHLRRLSHHDPEFPYDPEHEYEADWTTDADYREDGVRLYGYSDEGVLMPDGNFHDWLVQLMVRTLCLVLGNRVCREPDLHHSAGISEDLNQLTASGVPRMRRAPDVAVMPESWTLPPAQVRTIEERIIRLDRGDPAPELVIELLSRTNKSKDFHDNRKLYAALGIPEYIIVDSGEFSDAPRMWLFRLDDRESAYRMVERGTAITACGTPMRLIDAPVDGDVPVFQCRDANGHWQDHEGHIAQRAVQRAELGAVTRILRGVLTPRQLDQVGEVWTAGRVPSDAVERALAVRDNPALWRTLLAEPDDRPAADRERDDDRPPPRDW